ncbi:MAG: EamA family transporter [Patescibacteria group bacterium]|jgi:transporter family protein
MPGIWILFAILSAVFAALVAIFGKVGISNLDTTLATTVRSVVMAVFLVMTSLVFGKAKLLSTIHPRALLFIVLAGVAGALSWLFYFFALKNGPAPAVAALDRLSVVFVLILALIFLGEHLTWKTGIGALLITTGAIFIVLK